MLLFGNKEPTMSELDPGERLISAFTNYAECETAPQEDLLAYSVLYALEEVIESAKLPAELGKFHGEQLQLIGKNVYGAYAESKAADARSAEAAEYLSSLLAGYANRQVKVTALDKESPIPAISLAKLEELEYGAESEWVDKKWLKEATGFIPKLAPPYVYRQGGSRQLMLDRKSDNKPHKPHYRVKVLDDHNQPQVAIQFL
jgi:hypothetical protein